QKFHCVFHAGRFSTQHVTDAKVFGLRIWIRNNLHPEPGGPRQAGRCRIQSRSRPVARRASTIERLTERPHSPGGGRRDSPRSAIPSEGNLKKWHKRRVRVASRVRILQKRNGNC